MEVMSSRASQIQLDSSYHSPSVDHLQSIMQRELQTIRTGVVGSVRPTEEKDKLPVCMRERRVIKSATSITCVIHLPIACTIHSKVVI